MPIIKASTLAKIPPAERREFLWRKFEDERELREREFRCWAKILDLIPDESAIPEPQEKTRKRWFHKILKRGVKNDRP